jgi:hypothetical protein
MRNALPEFTRFINGMFDFVEKSKVGNQDFVEILYAGKEKADVRKRFQLGIINYISSVIKKDCIFKGQIDNMDTCWKTYIYWRIYPEYGYQKDSRLHYFYTRFIVEET